jgi:hypothetical protein
MDKTIVNSIHFDPVNRFELLKLIIELNSNKSCGTDDVCPTIIRDVAYIVAEPFVRRLCIVYLFV